MVRTKRSKKSKGPYYLRSTRNVNDSQGTKNLRSTPAFITFAEGTPPGVFLDGVDEPGPEIAENLNLPYEKYQFLDDEIKIMAQINYIMWATGAPEKETTPVSIADNNNNNADKSYGKNGVDNGNNQRQYRPYQDNYGYGIASSSKSK